jgi:hypothetical protein
MEDVEVNATFWKGKRVLLTGHSGLKLRNPQLSRPRNIYNTLIPLHRLLWCENE